MLVLCVLGLVVVACHGSTNPIVKTPLGSLKGSTQLSRDGRPYHAFTNVPFAKPPVGRLRFMPPEPADPWDGTLDASEESSPICIQSAMLGYIGEEDCLYLNVYTPKLNSSLPVMVYFHGGGWRTGAPGSVTTSKFFMDEDVVLVMPSYRVGPFGFLSTEDEEIPGNMGLKDMALAIEWTEENIKNFGGDSKSITAFGLSAGGVSTNYLCSVLRTRGLLKGCISESGVGGAFWSLFRPGIARTSAFKVANSVGCFGSGLLQCLQSKRPEELLKTEKLLKFWTNEPLIIYGPVLERKGESALITEWPTDSNFPWLTGIAGAEGKMKSGGLVLFPTEKSYSDEFYSHKEEYLMRMLYLNESKRDAVTKVYNRFFKNNNFLDGMEKFYSEVFFIQPVLKELKSHTGPKYFYVFNFTEGPSAWEIMTHINPNLTQSGASHGDNFYYYFDVGHYAPKYTTLTPKQQQLSKDLIKLWVNFAKFQNPSPEGKPEWRPAGDKNSYLMIGNSGFSMNDYQNVQEIFDFWKQIF